MNNNRKKSWFSSKNSIKFIFFKHFLESFEAPVEFLCIFLWCFFLVQASKIICIHWFAKVSLILKLERIAMKFTCNFTRSHNFKFHSSCYFKFRKSCTIFNAFYHVFKELIHLSKFFRKFIKVVFCCFDSFLDFDLFSITRNLNIWSTHRCLTCVVRAIGRPFEETLFSNFYNALFAFTFSNFGHLFHVYWRKRREFSFDNQGAIFIAMNCVPLIFLSHFSSSASNIGWRCRGSSPIWNSRSWLMTVFLLISL